jgi:hypothetical protein
MNRLVSDKLAEVRKLCLDYRVRRLELFGSAACDGACDKPAEDLDFLVEFLPLNPGEHADAYFGLLKALEEMFGMPVDLVMLRAVKNPYFLESIRATRRRLYAA